MEADRCFQSHREAPGLASTESHASRHARYHIQYSNAPRSTTYCSQQISRDARREATADVSQGRAKRSPWKPATTNRVLNGRERSNAKCFATLYDANGFFRLSQGVP